eukprot:g29012.t1
MDTAFCTNSRSTPCKIGFIPFMDSNDQACGAGQNCEQAPNGQPMCKCIWGAQHWGKSGKISQVPLKSMGVTGVRPAPLDGWQVHERARWFRVMATALSIRRRPEVDAPLAGELPFGEVFQAVSSTGEDGFKFLELSRGRGWVFSDARVQPVLVIDETAAPVAIEAERSLRKGERFDEADPNWFWNWDSQLAAKSKAHADFQTMMLDISATAKDTEILPHIADWEEAGGFPEDLTAKAYAAGVYAAGLPKEYGGTGEEMDPWRRFIYNDELGRSCAGGLWASLLTHGISLPPILALGSEQQKQKYAKDFGRWASGGVEQCQKPPAPSDTAPCDRIMSDIITGVKRCSLAITEPNGGSDVANIQTTAVREKDVYVVTGQKTYISGGMNADYFTTGVRTGSSGIGGISLLMIHRDYPGVQTTRLKTQGWGVSTTTSVAFNDVRVPVENRLGFIKTVTWMFACTEPNQCEGFLPIMLNFNNERMSMAYAACRMSRCCLEDAIRFARVRKTFGKPLVQQQVIRHKMAEMARLILSTHGFLASVTETMAGDDYGQLAGKVALAKILGGRSYLRGNHIGGRIERSYREVRVYAIGGGSEEIMLDLAARAAKL